MDRLGITAAESHQPLLGGPFWDTFLQAHPTWTNCHTQVSGKKVRTVLITPPPGAAPRPYFLMAMIRGAESLYTEETPHPESVVKCQRGKRFLTKGKIKNSISHIMPRWYSSPLKFTHDGILMSRFVATFRPILWKKVPRTCHERAAFAPPCAYQPWLEEQQRIYLKHRISVICVIWKRMSPYISSLPHM